MFLTIINIYIGNPVAAPTTGGVRFVDQFGMETSPSYMDYMIYHQYKI